MTNENKSFSPSLPKAVIETISKSFRVFRIAAETDLILGAAVLDAGGDEIINMFAAIMHSDIPCYDYRKVVLVHPTVSALMPFMLDGIHEAKENSK